jgi:hypothetical protein
MPHETNLGFIPDRAEGKQGEIPHPLGRKRRQRLLNPGLALRSVLVLHGIQYEVLESWVKESLLSIVGVLV